MDPLEIGNAIDLVLQTINLAIVYLVWHILHRIRKDLDNMNGRHGNEPTYRPRTRLDHRD